jgi:hypothetical protein
MAEEFDPINAPTSPELETPDTNITSEKAFTGAMMLDLTDDQIAECIKIIVPIRERYRNKFIRMLGDPFLDLDDVMDVVEQMEDELKTTLAERQSVLATIDATPLLEGQPIVIEWLGVLPYHDVNKYGYDHEREEWLVKKANERDEDYYGQKGRNA